MSTGFSIPPKPTARCCTTPIIPIRMIRCTHSVSMMGAGYVRGNERWRFIPYYLVFGQWKQVVQRGIIALSSAYQLTGDPVYAHKAAILLDRVADVYPAFDFMKQGILYESDHGNGYVSVWHDATIETREMAIAYDAIKPAIWNDKELVSFLSDKSRQYHTPNEKKGSADIATNIETRILKDALAHPEKIYSNYPQQYLTTAVLDTVLDWPANRQKVFALLDPVIEKSTAVDGVTGEKGLAGYSAYVIQRMAEFLKLQYIHARTRRSAGDDSPTSAAAAGVAIFYPIPGAAISIITR